MKQETLNIIEDLLKYQAGCKPATFRVSIEGNLEQVIIIDMAPKHLKALINAGYDIDISVNGCRLYKFK